MQEMAPTYRAPQPKQATIAQQTIQEPRGSLDVDDFAVLDLSKITRTSALPDLPMPRRLSALSLEYDHPARSSSNPDLLPSTPSDPEIPQLGCAVTAIATATTMARAKLSVTAPCYGNQRVTVHQSGLIFTDTTDADGMLNLTIPALSANAIFVVAFDNGKGTVATAHIPDLDAYDRVALQWDGPAGFQIHAREFGAGYGEAGHVWADALSQGKGMVTKLGEPNTLLPKLAEIYTFPTGTSEQVGTITLSIETEVTEANCGRDISALSFELRTGLPLRTRDLSLSIPNCSATGDFLVLNNLVEDLKIASK